MTISPNRSTAFHGTDLVAGALRAVLSTGTMSHSDRAAEPNTGRVAAMSLQALYPSLFEAARPARRSWSLRRLVPQH